MKLKFSSAFLFMVFVGLIIVYFFMLPLNMNHNRYTMFFLNMRNGKVETEARYVLKNPNKPKEIQLVEELILGPMNHSFYAYFEKDTQFLSCFVDGETLYLSFPKKIILDVQEKMPFKKFYDLFCKNIFVNFSNINEICMFLDGTLAYEIAPENPNIGNQE